MIVVSQGGVRGYGYYKNLILLNNKVLRRPDYGDISGIELMKRVF